MTAYPASVAHHVHPPWCSAPRTKPLRLNDSSVRALDPEPSDPAATAHKQNICGSDSRRTGFLLALFMSMNL